MRRSRCEKWRGPLAGDERATFLMLDFGDVDGPLQPDWQNLETEGILPHLRKAKKRI